MPRRPWFLLVLSIAVGIVGCQRAPASAEKPHASPAKVARPVSESQFNTIELVSEAVQRLGLETAKVEQREMSPIRSYGAELVLPEIGRAHV